MAPWGAIFDWDGVVVDSSGLHEASWEQLAQESGRSLPSDHFQRGFGRRNEEIMAHLFGWTDDSQELTRLAARKEQLYRELVRTRGLSVIAGSRAWLTMLRQAGIPCVVASSTPRENITCVLEPLTLAGTFSAIVASEDVTRGKPDPEVFLLAATRLKLPPSQCVVFEDVPAGIQAARAAGIRVIALTTTFPAKVLREADLVVSRLDVLTLEALEVWFTHPRIRGRLPPPPNVPRS